MISDFIVAGMDPQIFSLVYSPRMLVAMVIATATLCGLVGFAVSLVTMSAGGRS